MTIVLVTARKPMGKETNAWCIVVAQWHNFVHRYVAFCGRKCCMNETDNMLSDKGKRQQINNTNTTHKYNPQIQPTNTTHKYNPQIQPTPTYPDSIRRTPLSSIGRCLSTGWSVKSSKWNSWSKNCTQTDSTNQNERGRSRPVALFA